MASRRDLTSWLDYIQSVHTRTIDLSLDRVQRVMSALNLVRRRYTVIGIAGTNGKGSCVGLLEAALCYAGLSVASYTSPHLVRFNERIRINKDSVPDGRICQAFERIDSGRGDIPLTYFEFCTLAALEIFQNIRLDVAILEVGLGGRLDAVNCVDADIALITSIGLDHTQWLGNDVESIAKEKAGIFRRHKPAICSPLNPPESLIEAARNRGSFLLRQGIDFGYKNTDTKWDCWVAEVGGFGGEELETRRLVNFVDLPSPSIPGYLQKQNVAGVAMALQCLPFQSTKTRQVLVHALENCELPGRLQSIEGSPRQIFDVAHNIDAVNVLREFLQGDNDHAKTYAVVGMLRDKPVRQMLAQLTEVIDVWHVASLEDERGSPARYLYDCILENDQSARAHMHGNILNAYKAAMDASSKPDRVVIFGSFFTVGAIMRHLNMRPYT